jgi:thioredoxin-related protein
MFDGIINKYARNSICLQNDYNLFFIVSLDDCNCIYFHLTVDFINQIEELSRSKSKTIALSFIIIGNYSDQEKTAFVGNVKNRANVFMDNNSMFREGLAETFGVSTTPLFIVLNKSGHIKYWQSFGIEDGTNSDLIKNNLLALLTAMK